MKKTPAPSVYFCRKSMEFIHLDDVMLKFLKDQFPKVDVDLELRRMKMWLLSERGQRSKGTMLFISKWLRNALENVYSRRLPEDEETSSNPLTDFINKYLENLWSERQYLTTLNTISKPR